MKNSLTLYLFFIFLVVGINTSISFAQGSGNELVFDGTDDYFDGNGSGLSAFSNNFTMEMWVNPTATITVKSQQNGLSAVSGTSPHGQRYAIGPSWGSNFCGSAATAGAGISVGTNCIQVYEHKGCYMPCLLSYSVALSGWNHIAVVYTAKTPSLYLNGVLVATGLTSNQTNVFPSVSIGGYIYGYYQGKIDEVRIWSESRTLSQIRDNMCKKLIGSEANLQRYYRLDNVSGAGIATDASGHQNGSLTNMATASCWVTSGAPLGDVSSHLYTNSWSGQTINLSSAARGNFEVNTVSGTPNGVHLFRVDSVPNTTSGLTGLGGNNKYFGTFVSGGTAPTYSAVYDYTSFTAALADEANLVMNTRAHNAATPWTNSSATLNTGANTMTKTGISARGEFILSNPVTPLPIEMLSFTARRVGQNVKVNWETATEINNDYFSLERSSDGQNFLQIATVDGAGNSSANLQYQYMDHQPLDGVSYYRLKQTDFNGEYSYSNIVAVDYSILETNFDFNCYPNPTAGELINLTISGLKGNVVNAYLYDVVGKICYSNQFVLQNDGQNSFMLSPTSQLAEGVYFLNIVGSDKQLTKKITINK